MKLKQCFFTESKCYNSAQVIEKVAGIVVHSTGANQPALARYVQPSANDPKRVEIIADIGRNKYNNHWNKPTKTKCVHAFIGKNAAGVVETYQTLPYSFCAWGVGRGKKGSYNYNPTAHLQFEICEDGLKDSDYFAKVITEAAEFCAYLCKEFDLDVDQIVSHKEVGAAGYGSKHRDIDHWLKKFGNSMDWFRATVAELIGKPPSVTVEPYSVRVTAREGVNIRAAAGVESEKVGALKKSAVVKIDAENKAEGAELWGRLEDGRGWIALDYTEKIDSFKPYDVKVIIPEGVNIRAGAGSNTKKKGALKKGTVVTIVEEKTGTGADLWGRLEDGRGWIALDYTKKVG